MNKNSVTEADLVKKIQELKKIRPRKDWVVLTKSQILGEEPKILFFPFFKPALATITALGILFGIFSLAQNSLPGDILYPIKKITEKSQAVFVSEEELPKYNLEIANKRLEELNEIAQTNQVKKLAPAISEFQASVSEAAKNLVKLKKVDKKIVEEAVKIGKNTKNTEEILATKIFPEETEESLNDFYKTYAQMLIKDLEESTLAEEQKLLLEEAKEDFETSNYSQALEKILILSYQ